MKDMRATAPAELAGSKVVKVVDYLDTEATGLPSSNVLQFFSEAGDVVSVKDRSRSSAKFKELAELAETRLSPSWLEVDRENLTATLKQLPIREELDYEVNEQLVVELYSK